MTDRQSTTPNRITFTDENTGIVYTGVWAYADNPTVDGTLMNKAAFLKDATATAIGLTQADPTVDDALSKLQTNINTKANSSEKGAASGIATLDTNTKVTPRQATSKIVSVTASKTLALSDLGTFQQVNSSSAVTITVPLNANVAFSAGDEIEFCRWGTGTLTFAGADGVTINSVNSKKSVVHRFGCVCLKRGQNDNTWLLAGDIG